MKIKIAVLLYASVLGISLLYVGHSMVTNKQPVKEIFIQSLGILGNLNLSPRAVGLIQILDDDDFIDVSEMDDSDN